MTRIACLLLIALSACTDSSSSSTEIATTPLAGKVSGQAWTVKAGQTDAFLSSGQTDFFAVMYPTAFTTCTGTEPTGPHIIVSIPKMPGDYPMSLSRNMTFTDGNNNLIAVNGRIVVDEVTATHVTGGLHGTYDGGNEVDGQFDITVCPAQGAN